LAYNIYKILLSNKGYVVIQLRGVFSVGNADIITIYSINGIQIAYQRLDEIINSMMLDPLTEYFLITGGTKGIVRQFCIVTLKHDVIHKIQIKPEEKQPQAILALNLIGKTAIFIGLANNQLEYIEWKPN